MTLTIYSHNFDTKNEMGFHGECFVEDGLKGIPFKHLSDALEYMNKNGVKLDDIVYCYRKDDEQLFVRYKVGIVKE